jgi:hypothetical protein
MSPGQFGNRLLPNLAFRPVRVFEMAYARQVGSERRKAGGFSTANPPQRAQKPNVYGFLNRSPRYFLCAKAAEQQRIGRRGREK